MLSIFFHWLRIMLLCRVGLHKGWMETKLTPEITITECVCCHLSYVERNGRVYNFNQPDALIAARGLLDRQKGETDAIDQNAVPASARGWRLHTAAADSKFKPDYYIYEDRAGNPHYKPIFDSQRDTDRNDE